MSKNILIVGADLTSNGGIASVIKSHYKAYQLKPYPFNLFLLKTNYYKDKTLLFEILILFKAFFCCLYYILFKNVKVLHIHSSANISFFRKSIFVLIGKITGRKVVLHLHSSDFYGFFLTQNQILKKYISSVFSQVDKIIVLCSDWEEKLKQAYNIDHILKIANPIDLEDSSLSSKVVCNGAKRMFTLVFVGFLIESKGIKDLLEAMKQINDKGYTNIKLIIAGKGELESYILKFVAKNQLLNSVDFVGWVSGKAKDNLYKKSNTFILPSYKEGMPISILEAMNFGLPIISSNISGIPDVISVPRNGFLVTPGDVKQIVEAIIQCYEDEDLMKTMSKNNLEDIRNFSSHQVFNQITEIYSQLLK
ncbi:glycosyltransferase family 4 protein [Winogradskyella sp.]|jgi:glycosyltransferase involved in cell wall biosynthesis|uniref:glycosyltransferase family 4 protein n=1 Tax=Winogradskyella sp. TaxID=1883156 RepID=UPI0025FFF913|nr:glycosyltransferase family 4 protein [Winogradskyella sp.]MCT4630857.1 glycosyltransferase family 4 protein [Winogradskyella sp.]